MAVKVRALLALSLAGAVTGCGEGETSAPPSAKRAAPPPPSQIQRGREPRQAAPPQPNPSATAKVKAPEEEPWPEGVPREDVFKAFLRPEANYLIGPASGGPHPNDWFVAVLPEDNADSTTFSAVLPEWAGDKGTPAPEAQLPEGFTMIESAGYSDDGWPRRIRCEADGAEMVYVPGGAFVQGMENADPNAAPAHPAVVDSFYIDRTEVTVGQYQRFLQQGSVLAGRPPQPPVNASAPANSPALGVPWREAQSYTEWAGKALPTESEWELAARGPRSFVHPWGNGRAAWERHREPGQIDPVGSFRTDRSVFDVLDMAGNAREWVADFYDPRAYEQAQSRDGSPIRNWTGPKRPSPANHKVVKGGGPDWQLWHRASASMRASEPDIGFRCVLRVSPGQQTASTPQSAAPVSPRRSAPRIPAP